MAKKLVTFDALASITPDFAAKLANCASAYSATVHLECGKTRLCVDSLISILALALRRGMPVEITADGDDAESAVHALSALLTTKQDG